MKNFVNFICKHMRTSSINLKNIFANRSEEFNCNRSSHTLICSIFSCCILFNIYGSLQNDLGHLYIISIDNRTRSPQEKFRSLPPSSLHQRPKNHQIDRHHLLVFFYQAMHLTILLINKHNNQSPVR